LQTRFPRLVLIMKKKIAIFPRRFRRRPRVFDVRERVDPGAAPGTLVIDPRATPSRITAMAFDEGSCEEAQLETVDEVPAWLGRNGLVWIHVAGLGDGDAIRRLADLVAMHGLALEDVVHAHQRPKVDEYDDRLFVVARSASALEDEVEQISMLADERLLVSFQERPGDDFEAVRRRIREGKGRIRSRGVDYLVYALLDAIVDAYFPLLEDLGDRMEELEDAVISRPSQEMIAAIHDNKHDVLRLRRVLWSTREMLRHLIRDDTPLVSDDTRVYFRDSLDHAAQLLDIIEHFRHAAFGMTDVYLSAASHRMNEIMKVLTIIATIFIPLTFIAGVYGMNFAVEASPWNMPELRWHYGYPFCLGLMLATAGALVLYFRRLGWLGSRGRENQGMGPGGHDRNRAEPAGDRRRRQ
jgi:magnesium transporter